MAVEIKPIQMARITLWIKGTSPLVQHAWSAKAREMLIMTAAERRKVPKTARKPKEEAEGALYRTDDGAYGIPAMGFKASLIGAAHKDIGLEKTLLRKSMFIECDDKNQVIPIESEDPIINEAFVRVGAGSTDIRYRPEFKEWRCQISLLVNYESLNESDIVNLVNRAGFGVGLCEWRPEKGGDWGRYEVDKSENLKVEVL